MNRRQFFRWCTILYGSILAWGHAIAAWPTQAFNARSMTQALTALFPQQQSTPNDNIRLIIPEIAENGAIVPVKIDASALPKVTQMSLFAEKNRQPLVAVFHIPVGTLAQISTRIRLAESAPVRVVVQANGKLYHYEKFVNVVVGGCVA